MSLVCVGCWMGPCGTRVTWAWCEILSTSASREMDCRCRMGLGWIWYRLGGHGLGQRRACNDLGSFWRCAMVGEEGNERIRYQVDGGKAGGVPDSRHGSILRIKVTIRTSSLLELMAFLTGVISIITRTTAQWYYDASRTSLLRDNRSWPQLVASTA